MNRLVACRIAVADVHREADERTEVVTQARLGDTAEVLTETGEGWLRLRFLHDGYEGWSRRAAFAAGIWPPPGAAVVRARVPFALVHAGPTVQDPLVVTAPLGAPLLRRPDRGPAAGRRWIPVEAPGGVAGFVLAGALCDGTDAWKWTTRPQLAASLVSQARALLRLPYRWGGTTPYGFDCSGFVQCLFRLHGIDLPRDVYLLAKDPRLPTVDAAGLAAGDLLVFSGATHIGLAMSAEEFIHATTAGSPIVQVSAVDDPAWIGLRERCCRMKLD